MNILLIGSGGREHTLAWKIEQSPLCKRLFIAPGNAGTALHGENIQIDPLDFEEVEYLCKVLKINMIVVGPEQPLVMGLADHFKGKRGFADLIIIGPTKEGAMLEGSKDFSKKFMKRHKIPTAGYETFKKSELKEAKVFLKSMKEPYVLKADGLAAGKGVIISKSLSEAEKELELMLDGKFGQASEKVVIEEFLDGIEFSVFALTDGKDYIILPEAKDYKRIGEGDSGLNTGGMGAISPVPFVDEAMMQKVIDRIIDPTVSGLRKEKIDYKGFIFFGLISVNGEPYLIEYNCRLGDPETEVVLPRLKNDIVELFQACGAGKLDIIEIEKDPRSAVTVVMVSGGYPESYEKGYPIEGELKTKKSNVFHAGTKKSNGSILTNGGRVLAITSFGKSKEEALKKSYATADKIEFKDKYLRRDIGFDI
ncbi:MAG: phosphoribosylamine--glycine ligase [Bacteroidia bacterium]|nr:phosphoribosylamine--glycine ligase [Bacteroidia bacterium]